MENLRMMVSEVESSNRSWWTSVQRHWLAALVTSTAVFAGVSYLVLQAPNLYRSQSLILIGNKVSVPVIQSEDSEDSAAGAKANNLSTDIEVLKSQSLLMKAFNKLDAAYQEISPAVVSQNLLLLQPKDTTVLSVSYEDTDPNRAKAFLDALVATYLEYGRNSQRSPVTNAVQFIEKRLPQAQIALEKSSGELTNFRVNNNLGNGKGEINLAYAQKENFREKVMEAELNLYQTEQQYKALQSQVNSLQQDPKTLLTDAVLSQDSNYQSILKQLQALTVEYQLDKSIYTDEHPRTQLIKERIDQLNQLLVASSRQVIGNQSSKIAAKKIENGEILQALGSQLAQIQITLITQKQQLPKLRQQEKLANLNLERLLKLQQTDKILESREAANTQAVNVLNQKLQELRIRGAQETSTWKVIEPPTLSSFPIAKDRNRGLILSFLAGILSGIGVAIWLEKLDRRFRDIQELKQMIPLPILAVIPKAQGEVSVFKNSELGLSPKSTPFTEAIRSLSLSLQKSNNLGQLIAITAATTGEGTTTITSNLGLALAELGKRVLIVDTNLADPSLHKIFSLSNTQGLTTAIATDLSWQKLIQSTGLESSRKAAYSSDTSANNANFLIEKSIHGEISTSGLTATQLLDLPAPPLTATTHQNNLDVLTSGPVISSSFLWLISPKMEVMLEQWRQTYDYILMDTSALSELADAQNIISKVDEVVFVVNMRKVERSVVMNTLEIFQRNQSQVTGIIVNNLE